MGTPEFAVASLDALVKAGYICRSNYAPDKPAGRGMKMQQSEVKICSKARIKGPNLKN
jgi:methionyl-tRNA formyltransferase